MHTTRSLSTAILKTTSHVENSRILFVNLFGNTHEQFGATVVEIVKQLLQPFGLVLPSDGHHVDGNSQQNDGQSDANFHRSFVARENHQKGADYEERDWQGVVHSDWSGGVGQSVAHIEQPQNADCDEKSFYELDIVDQDVDIASN